MVKSMKKKIIYVIIIIMAISFIYSIFNVYLYLKDHSNTVKLQKIIDTSISKTTIPDSESLTNPPTDHNDSSWNYLNEPFLKVDFNELTTINPDTVAYIEVAGTAISYPVVKTSDNTFYLTHSFDQSKNKAGWIFLDYRNNLETLSDNTIIYGHARNDGTMFGTLKKLLSDSWFTNPANHLIKISTPQINYIFQIFSIYTISAETYYLDTYFPDANLFQKYLDTIKRRSLYPFNTATNYHDRLLTLSTCYDTNGTRIVVHAKLIKKGLNNPF